MALRKGVKPEAEISRAVRLSQNGKLLFIRDYAVGTSLLSKNEQRVKGKTFFIRALEMDAQSFAILADVFSIYVELR